MISEAIKQKILFPSDFRDIPIHLFDDGWCMSEEDTEKYIETILSLRKKYSGTIDILLGTERDFCGRRQAYIQLYYRFFALCQSRERISDGG